LELIIEFMELRSLTRGLHLIELFTHEKPVLTFDEIRGRCRFPASTLYRFLDNLTRAGLLTLNSSTKEYRLGAPFIRLGQAAQKGIPLLELCYPLMRRLSSETGESVFLSIREGRGKTCVGCVESERRPIRYVPGPGSVAPLHVGASGRAILAFVSQEELKNLVEKGKLVSVTPKTITDKVELKERLVRIRETGYDYSEGESVVGAWGLGFPILDPTGSACASLTLAGTMLDPLGPRLNTFVKIMKRSVAEIESELWNKGQEAHKQSRTAAKQNKR
jgi:DNA-binding IclR family transcriptional regulator